MLNQIQNKSKRRNYSVLKSHIWTDVINDELIKTNKLPCNFIYKWVKVHTDQSRSKHFIDFEACCKDDKCKANLKGWCDEEPNEGNRLIVIVMASDTKGLEHQHTTKRPLKKIKRKNVWLELEKDVVSNWRRDNKQNMEFGSFSPPNVYNLETLRKLSKKPKKEN